LISNRADFWLSILVLFKNGQIYLIAKSVLKKKSSFYGYHLFFLLSSLHSRVISLVDIPGRPLLRGAFCGGAGGLDVVEVGVANFEDTPGMANPAVGLKIGIFFF
jgi:hypothetical protein